jgi:hypothetical protein
LFKASKAIAAALVEAEPGSMRELHSVGGSYDIAARGVRAKGCMRALGAR